MLALNNRDNKFQNNKYQSNRGRDVSRMFDYFSDYKKKVLGMFDYYNGTFKEEGVNLVLENGEYATDEEIVKRKK